MEKFLQISVQDFEQMITGNFVYVDKTRYVYEMVRIPQAFYFLSRPRRFGKTLLVSTLKALFEGRRDLFKGLWIENSDWKWQAHPVVQIDFNGVKASNAEALEKSLLVNLIKEKDYPILDLENLQVREATFSTYDLENLKLDALLFQTGYVTIHDYDGALFRLGYPNQEVKTAFLSFLYDNLVEIANTGVKEQFIRLHQYLAEEDLEQFIETANAILASIPYTQIHGQATPAGNEQYYHTVFYLMVAASGVLVQTEPLSSHRRMDIAVEFKDKVHVIALKCNQPADAAIQQIHEKRYHEKYLQSGRRIHLVGINFNTTERRIVDWRMEAVERQPR